MKESNEALSARQAGMREAFDYIYKSCTYQYDYGDGPNNTVTVWKDEKEIQLIIAKAYQGSL